MWYRILTTEAQNATRQHKMHTYRCKHKCVAGSQFFSTKLHAPLIKWSNQWVHWQWVCKCTHSGRNKSVSVFALGSQCVDLRQCGTNVLTSSLTGETLHCVRGRAVTEMCFLLTRQQGRRVQTHYTVKPTWLANIAVCWGRLSHQSGVYTQWRTTQFNKHHKVREERGQRGGEGRRRLATSQRRETSETQMRHRKKWEKTRWKSREIATLLVGRHIKKNKKKQQCVCYL